MKRAVFAALLLTALQAGADGGAPATVGGVIQNNGLEKDRFVYVRTPSILHVAKAAAPAPEVLAAIDNYDHAAQLSPDPLIRAESLRRAADLRLRLLDAGDADAQPAELDRIVAGYQRILADYPGYAENDRVLYQLARAQQLQGQTAAAIDTLRDLGRRYPQSSRMSDAVFRAAELLYARERYDEAEQEYRTVLAQGEGTPYYRPAQYKYGWALYKQARYREAAAVFLAILDRNLPQPAPDDPAAALAGVAPNQREISGDALRVAGLSFAALGGGAALNDYCAAAGEPRFAVLLYQSLGQQMLDRRRYSDAANAYAAFIQRHPGHPLAPQMQTQAIAAYREGGFDEQLAQAEARYADSYEPGSPYWKGSAPDAAVTKQLHDYLGELAAWHHARAQQAVAADSAARQAEFIAAAGWYRRLLDDYPQDGSRAETNLHYADALYDGGRLREAAAQYEQTAYGYAGNSKAAEAAYAAVQVWQRVAQEVPAAERPEVLRQSVAADLRYAGHFGATAQTPAVLTHAAEDLYEVKDLDQAIAVSGRVLAGDAAPELRRKALAVQADARFGRGGYAAAETAYGALLPLLPPADAGYRTAQEQLAAAIYKQGESARDAGDLLAAARHFQRVGQAVPDSHLRANADYDAASAYFAAQDWQAAQTALEGFRSRNPQSPLLPDADKKLAQAYRKNGADAAAAEVYARIAARPGESADTRREAAWLSAALYDQAPQPLRATEGYQAYIKSQPQDLDRGIEARQRLAAMAGDASAHRRWLQDIVAVDAAAGAARSDHSKLAAARAQLELGRIDAGKAAALALNAPLAASLAKRKQAAEVAIAELGGAAAYGYAEVTTAATYEIGTVYRDFGRALLDSQRPARLQGEALEQYQLLLEEQADPFEEKAIAAYRANVQRLGQGLWNDWIRQSAVQLAELAPAQYGKHEQGEDSYDSLH